MILCKSVSGNKYEKIWGERRQQRLQKEEQRVKHDLLLNIGKLTSNVKCGTDTPGELVGPNDSTVCREQREDCGFSARAQAY